jgi:hypothetical protein
MPLNAAHLREAGVIAGAFVVTFAAMRTVIHALGPDSPFAQGTIAVVWFALSGFLLRRYLPRGPLDSHRQRVWFLSAFAGSNANDLRPGCHLLDGLKDPLRAATGVFAINLRIRRSNTSLAGRKMPTKPYLMVAGTIGVVALAIISPAGNARPSDRSPESSRSSCQRGTPIGSCRAFDVRAASGKAAEQKEEFRAYYAAMNGQVGDQYAATMRSCFATVHEPQTDPFTLVADITPEGKLADVEVRPATNIAACFAAGLTAISFPKPPHYPGHAGLPMVIEMRIR